MLSSPRCQVTSRRRCWIRSLHILADLQGHRQIPSAGHLHSAAIINLRGILAAHQHAKIKATPESPPPCVLSGPDIEPTSPASLSALSETRNSKKALSHHRTGPREGSPMLSKPQGNLNQQKGTRSNTKQRQETPGETEKHQRG